MSKWPSRISSKKRCFRRGSLIVELDHVDEQIAMLEKFKERVIETR